MERAWGAWSPVNSFCFSEAGWNTDENKVFRAGFTDSGRWRVLSLLGLNLAPHCPPHLGRWHAMNLTENHAVFGIRGDGVKAS